MMIMIDLRKGILIVPCISHETQAWKEKVRKLGANTIKCSATGSHLPTFGFLSLQKAQMIEPTTTWTAVSSPSGSTRYLFLHLSGVGRALGANSGEGSAQ